MRCRSLSQNDADSVRANQREVSETASARAYRPRGVRWTILTLGVLCILMAVTLLAVTRAATAGETIKNPFLGKAEKIAEGKGLYRRLCYICHRNAGARGPNLRKSRLDDEAFFNTVMLGRQGGMPAWRSRLSADDVWKIHAYVKDWK